MTSEFQRYVLSWLDRRGWSQARLSEACGMSQSLLAKYLTSDEDRRVRPSPDTLRRMSPVFSEPYENLLQMCGYLDRPAQIEKGKEHKSELRRDWDAMSEELFQQLARTPEHQRATIMQAVTAYITAQVKMIVDLGQITSGADPYPERRLRQIRRTASAARVKPAPA
jgi:transcriptional regulator with XRE-family HTH domain